MNRIPEIHIRNGEVVSEKNGEYTVLGNPVKIMRDMSGFDEFYIVDLEGLEKNRLQMDVISRLGEEFTIWVEGGFRRVGDVADALVLGAETAVISTKTVESMEEIRKSAELSEHLAVCIDYADGKIIGWGAIPERLEEMAEHLRTLCIRKVLFSNTGKYAPADDVLSMFDDFEVWLKGNLPDVPESVNGLIIPHFLI